MEREHSLFREHSGDIQGTFREHSGNIQGTFREHSGNITHAPHKNNSFKSFVSNL
jgi:hypothetical protein